MKRTSADDLVSVLQEAQAFLKHPGNEFAWSSWEDAQEAIAEIDRFIRQIQAGDYSCALDISVLFAPTGPIQEVSLSSGWGQEFLELEEWFDRAAEIMKR